MVGKIIKHDLKSLIRGLTFVGVACILLAVIGRILVATDADGIMSVLFSGLAVYVSFIMIFAAFIVSVAQFTRSLYTGEGYLTFSLPVTINQLLIGKILSAIIAMFYGVVIAVASTAIVLTGVPADVWQALGDEFGELFAYINSYLSSEPLLIVEIILYVIVLIPMSLLVLYLIASIGQLFNKHRKLFSIGIGILALIVVLPLLNAYCFQPILNAAYEVSVHLSMWIQIIVFAAVDVGSFFLVRYILTHKLNLIG